MASEAEMTRGSDTTIDSMSATDVSNDLTGADYDGPHMHCLRQALQKTRKKCVDSLKYSTFARKYTFAHETSPRVLRKVLEDFKEQLDNNIKGELEEMISQENLVPLFNNLDQLIKDGTTEDSTPAWRPSGNPQADVRDHLYRVKLEEKEKLQKLLQATEQETQRLCKIVNRKKQQFSETQQKIQVNLQFFDGAYEACRRIPSSDELDELVSDGANHARITE